MTNGYESEIEIELVTVTASHNICNPFIKDNHPTTNSHAWMISQDLKAFQRVSPSMKIFDDIIYVYH